MNTSILLLELEKKLFSRLVQHHFVSCFRMIADSPFHQQESDLKIFWDHGQVGSWIPVSALFYFDKNTFESFKVGTIMPGEYKFITIMFSPQLNATDLGNMHKKLELEQKMADEGEQDRGLGRKESIIKIDRKKSSAGMRRKKSEVLISIAGKAKAINKNSKFFWQARDYLTRIYQSNEDTYQIPCFIAPGTVYFTFPFRISSIFGPLTVKMNV